MQGAVLRYRIIAWVVGVCLLTLVLVGMPLKYLGGDESVVAEVSDVAWPKLLDPVDDLPPATIVLSVKRNGDKLTVRGVSHDNGKIRAVTVNDRNAAMTVIQAGLVDWSIELPVPKDGTITASATDAAGNREVTGHRVTVNRD